MADGKYLYFGVGIISIFLLAGIIVVFQTMPSTEDGGAKITIQLNEYNHPKEFSYYTTQEKLFSGENQTLNFSSAQNGVEFFSNGIKCNVSCEKEG